MSCRSSIESNLKRLGCPFTWGINESDIKDLCKIREKLLDRVKFGPRRYHGTYLNILAFVSYLQGSKKHALGFLLKAEKVLKEDNKADMEFLVNYANFAWVHYHSGNLRDAVTYLDKVEEVCKGIVGSSQYSCNLPVIYGKKGWTFLKRGASFYGRAKKSFQKALLGDPDNVSYNIGYAVVLYKLEGMIKNMTPESSEAVFMLRRSVLLEPNDSDVRGLLAFKVRHSDKRESLELIDDALGMSPDVPQKTRNVVRHLQAEGSIEKSLEILSEELKLTPGSSFLYYQIGLCHKRQLIQMLQTDRTIKRIPVAQKRAKTAQCISYFGKAVELKPSNIYAHVSLAEAYGENHQLVEAEKIFADLLTDDSLRESDRLHCHSRYGAFLLYKKKNEDQAIAQFKIAYQMQIERFDRMQAGKWLRQIAERRINAQEKAGEAFEILAFLCTMDKQKKQAHEYMKKAHDFSSETEDLAVAFDKGIKL